MKRLLAVLVSLCAIVPQAGFAASDFFSQAVIGTSSVDARFSNISLGNFAFKSADLNDKVTKTRYFLYQTKREAIKRYDAGEMNDYEAADVATELEGVAYSMNQYFADMKSYERTGRAAYQSLASANLTDASASYQRLSAATWTSVRRENAQ